jgi:thymidylate kinase
LLVIFLGPQGSGKTTQAVILKRKLENEGYRIAITESVHYTVFLRIWHKFLMFLTRRKIKYRFRSEKLIEEFVEPSFLAHMFKIDFIVNMISAIISALKIFLLSLFYQVVIEHEGFIYNHLAYLFFIYRKLFTVKFLLKKYQVFLRLLPKKRIVVILDTSNVKPIDLYKRYRKRGSLSEPWLYIKYQAIVYKTISSVEKNRAIYDASIDKHILVNNIFSFVLQNLELS